MKKYFAYLVVALMLAAMLSGCGIDADDGIIDTSPRPTDTIGTQPSMLPDVSPTIIPDSGTVGSSDSNSGTGSKSPQVGESDGVRVSPKVSENVSK